MGRSRSGGRLLIFPGCSAGTVHLSADVSAQGVVYDCFEFCFEPAEVSGEVVVECFVAGCGACGGVDVSHVIECSAL